MRYSLLSLFAASSFLANSGAFAESHSWTKHEIPVGSVVHLKEFGGSDVDLTVKSREISAIYVQWTDHTKKIKKWFKDANGYSRPSEVSPTTQHAIKKEKGIPVNGSNAYLIYTDEHTGLKVYFHDVITKQNRYMLLIEPGAPK